MERIGELLARAVARRCHKDELEKARQNQKGIAEDADPILIFIAQVGECSPQEVRERFSLSRSTAFRRLDAMVKSGQLGKSGSTRNTLYAVI
jgi:predicted HTH transcriptional regulator